MPKYTAESINSRNNYLFYEIQKRWIGLIGYANLPIFENLLLGIDSYYPCEAQSCGLKHQST